MQVRIISLLAVFMAVFQLASAQITTPFEKSNGNQTPTYEEVIAWWKNLAQQSPYFTIEEAGKTDSGEPLHLVLFSADKNFELPAKDNYNKAVILINNGIHPGEPDGIDASMLLAKELNQNKELRKTASNLLIGFIPVYNVGGALNRNSHTRANQEGPEAYGFRGNARNFDLNRDFTKMDSRNAWAFAEIFNRIKPHLYIETHVSNGADYQYTMTLLSTQHSKLGGPLGAYLNKVLEPKLYESMAAKKQPMTPYVNVWGSVPDSGWVAFLDGSRYSSGYAALHNTIGLVTETHMLKPYKQRVEATYQFLLSTVEVLSTSNKKIMPQAAALKLAVQAQEKNIAQADSLPLNWRADTVNYTPFLFKGYAGSYESSEVSGLERLKYHRDKPFEKEIPYYNSFVPTAKVKVPQYYVVPQGWWPVLDRLKVNGVQMKQINADTTFTAERYRITDYQTGNRPYEGHYLHSAIKAEAVGGNYKARKGDWLIATAQPARRFIVEVLEPEAPDSYFAWNFFDTILQQKEGFSPYVFEDVAAQMLKDNPELKKELEDAKANNEQLAKSAYMQLRWIYERSVYYEDAYLQYPVLRIP